MILHNPPEPGTGKNRIHFVLVTDHYNNEIERLTRLGAKPLTETKLPAVRWTTFADPEGNEFDLVDWATQTTANSEH